jgi:hypothetical protein
MKGNRTEFYGLKGVNSNLHLSEDSSPIDILHLFGNTEVFCTD